MIDRRLFVALRVGLSALVLCRITHICPLELDHHGWTDALEYWSDSTSSRSPLFGVGLAAWAERPVIVLRLTAACTMLLGVFPRASALLVGALGYALMASDRYRYFHHLHLLYVSCAWLALTPSGWRGPAFVARWPVWALQAQLVVLYAAAGIAKLDSAWLSGQTLDELLSRGLLRGSGAELAGVIGTSAFATLIAALELALVPLLLVPRGRRVGLLVVLVLHIGIEHSMDVSTFGANAVLLSLACLSGVRSAAVRGPRPVSGNP